MKETLKELDDLELEAKKMLERLVELELKTKKMFERLDELEEEVIVVGFGKTLEGYDKGWNKGFEEGNNRGFENGYKTALALVENKLQELKEGK